MTAECPTCGRDDFSSEMGMKQHHARAHNESIAGRLVSCDVCDESYRVKPSREDGRHLCSNECIGEWMSDIDTEKHWNYNGGKVKVTCEYCGDTYRLRPSMAENNSYCSKDCANSAKSEITGEDHPLYNSKQLSCEWCSSTYVVKNCRVDESRFCSARCRNEWMSSRTGEEHPLYEGFDSSVYKDGEWRMLSKKYRRWVGFCENCGDTENLQLHHVEPLSMGGDLFNNQFLVLCRSCHYGDFERWHPTQLEEYIDQNS